MPATVHDFVVFKGGRGSAGKGEEWDVTADTTVTWHRPDGDITQTASTHIYTYRDGAWAMTITRPDAIGEVTLVGEMPPCMTLAFLKHCFGRVRTSRLGGYSSEGAIDALAASVRVPELGG